MLILKGGKLKFDVEYSQCSKEEGNASKISTRLPNAETDKEYRNSPQRTLAELSDYQRPGA